jgi:hypothetical protein
MCLSRRGQVEKNQFANRIAPKKWKGARCRESVQTMQMRGFVRNGLLPGLPGQRCNRTDNQGEGKNGQGIGCARKSTRDSSQIINLLIGLHLVFPIVGKQKIKFLLKEKIY